LNSDFESLILNSKNLFNQFLESKITTLFTPKTRITEASLYSLRAGGKRIRPIFALNSFYRNKPLPQTVGTSDSNLLYICLALECVHTYSLIHDDLPAMDDDDTRRGFPTCHKKFDEETAILAGDALNSLGFYLLSFVKTNEPSEDPRLLSDLLQILHSGAGFSGMILGQMLDLIEEKNPSSDIKQQMINLQSIHEKKTGALIEASFLLGNRLRKDYLDYQSPIQSYAKEIGLLFQITDDILDIEGNKEDLGKTPGKDKKAGKLTYPSLYGMEETKKLKSHCKERALEFASQLPEGEQFFFLELPTYIAERKN
jgi:geranylgeranyl diphosphate synthase type II